MERFQEGTGKYRIEATVFTTEEGYILHLLGGEKPHVGAVIICQPRESLTGDGSTSCTTSSLPLIGHKDDIPARPLAEVLCKLTGQPVVAVSGIHIDNATGDDIAHLQQNIEIITEKMLQRFKESH
ncbi:MAG: hypothetical protein H0Z38_01035 [Firmicutes bacterium]|nr:hypothetical protein [Bacillota bacterium]